MRAAQVSVTQQAKDGDRHVYGAKSRFMTDKVLETFERISLPQSAAARKTCAPDEAATVDVVAELEGNVVSARARTRGS